MPRMEIDVADEILEAIRQAWRHNRKNISEEVLHQLGWTDPATFAGDLLQLGFGIASEDPRKFIVHVRERKVPIFREPKDARAGKRRREDESLRGYA